MLSLLTIIGVILTTIGAFLIGWNDIMSEDKAIEVGSSYYGGGNKEQNLKLPPVKELLRRSRNSKRGLFFVLIGALCLVLSATV